MVSIPPPASTGDTRYIGSWSGPTGWESIGCTKADEYFFTTSTYFGCSGVFFATECTSGFPSGSSTRPYVYYGCTGDSQCNTRTLHDNYPAPTPDPNQKIDMFCFPKGVSPAQLYRTFTLPTGSIAPSPIGSSSLASPTSSSNTNISTDESSTDESTKSSPGVIAGATIAGIIGLLVVGTLVWYIMRLRRKLQATPSAAAFQGHQYPAELPGYAMQPALVRS